MKVLKGQDILALGFMTFALFVGAGNIIFPPIVGLQAGPNVWMAALGFLITAVGLPVVTVIALAKVGGGMDALSSPIGKIAGGLLAAVAYLAVGPLFATPRTATVSFEVGLAPLTGESPLALFLYSSVYFLIVFFVSLYPGRLLDTVGRFLAPLKIIALAILGIAAVALPAGDVGVATPEYVAAPFSQGFINGYLTMDTLGALVFGIWADKVLYGNTVRGVIRTTFLLDSQGKIVKRWTNVRTPGHARRVLQAACEAGLVPGVASRDRGPSGRKARRARSRPCPGPAPAASAHPGSASSAPPSRRR